MRKLLLAVVIALAAVSAWELAGRGGRNATLAAGAALVAVGVPLLLLTRRQLGKAFSLMPKATTIVDRGLYSKIPHPMYVFLDVALLGVVIALRQRWLVVPWLAIVGTQSWQAHRETKVLERAFGDKYRQYRAQTWW